MKRRLHGFVRNLLPVGAWYVLCLAVGVLAAVAISAIIVVAKGHLPDLEEKEIAAHFYFYLLLLAPLLSVGLFVSWRKVFVPWLDLPRPRISQRPWRQIIPREAIFGNVEQEKQGTDTPTRVS
jgi:hypothetical protein